MTIVEAPQRSPSVVRGSPWKTNCEQGGGRDRPPQERQPGAVAHRLLIPPRSRAAQSGPQPQFITAAMQRGLDEEDEARGLYESRTGRATETVGFGLDDSGLWGASPDALVGRRAAGRQDYGRAPVRSRLPAGRHRRARALPRADDYAVLGVRAALVRRGAVLLAARGSARGAVGAGRGRTRADARRAGCVLHRDRRAGGAGVGDDGRVGDSRRC